MMVHLPFKVQSKQGFLYFLILPGLCSMYGILKVCMSDPFATKKHFGIYLDRDENFFLVLCFYLSTMHT